MAGLRMLIAALVIIGMAQGVQAGDWPMYGHDAAHTGVADEVVEPPLKLLWKYTTADFVTTSPIVSMGMVYVGSQDKNVYALNAATGAVKWNTYGTGTSSSVISGGVIYVSPDNNNKNVYAIDAATGTLRWRYKTEDSLAGAITISGGILYFESGYNVYVLTTGGDDGIAGGEIPIPEYVKNESYRNVIGAAARSI